MIETIEKVHFVRLHVYFMNIECYDVIFGYNMDNILNFNNLCSIYLLYTGMYDIQLCFHSPCPKLLTHNAQTRKYLKKQ